MDNMENTIQFSLDNTGRQTIREMLGQVFSAMQEKGYDPINQLVGYLLSGDPTYITSHKNARAMVRRFERDEILEELVAYYLNNNMD